MGLWFKLIFGHANNSDGWMCLSNVPELNYKKLESDNQEDAVYEVMGSLEFEVDYTPEIVQGSIRKIYPKVEFANGVPVWTPEAIAFYKPNVVTND
ncbi:hypothetical protein ACX0HA_08845 [Flavobacterium hauense]